MPRTKEFEEKEVLDRAIELFRRRGFQATSFGELTAELGVNRQSLYDTFGDKQTFFTAALKRYREKSLDMMRATLAPAGSIRLQLKKLFDDLIQFTCSDGSYGCLMINSMIELASSEASARALATAHARDIEGIFAQRLSAAQRAGEISADKDPTALARFLYHSMLGLGVAARALGDRESLRQSVRLALNVLD